MRGLAVLVCAFAVAGVAAGGVDLPPRASAIGPAWVDAHTVQFSYAQYVHGSYASERAVARDDGTGFAATTAPAVDPTVSPDGKHRYAIDSLTRVLLVDGKVVARGPVAYGPSNVAWSPDSTRLAFGGAGVWVVSIDGADLQPVHAGSAVAWLSPTELAVADVGEAIPVYVVGADGSGARLVATGYDSSTGLAVSPDGSELVFGSYNGWGYDRGDALYVASTAGVDLDVRRISPTVCTVADTVTTTGGKCFDGTDAADRIVGTKHGDIVVAGAGDDVIHAGDGQNVIEGQWGNDTIFSGSGPDDIHAGSGNDVVRSGAGADLVVPGPGRDVVDAGRGADHVLANDGERDVIDCGPGVDGVRADRFDVVRNCEHVTRLPASLDQGG